MYICLYSENEYVYAIFVFQPEYSVKFIDIKNIESPDPTKVIMNNILGS